jgi:site-specific DNA recombinase
MAAANELRPMLTAIRCAIYTRKSTDEGLDSDFNTLDAQRESAEAFIVSQRHEGWLALPEKYDDGGFTGQWRLHPSTERKPGHAERRTGRLVSHHQPKK